MLPDKIDLRDKLPPVGDCRDLPGATTAFAMMGITEVLNKDLVYYYERPLMNLHVKGRHLGDKPLLSKNIVSDISIYPDGATIRLDDRENLAWWLEVYLTKDQLKSILRTMEEGSNCTSG